MTRIGDGVKQLDGFQNFKLHQYQGVPSIAAMMTLGSTAAPIIGQLSISPDPVMLGATEITLSADEVVDPDGTVALVEFYRESNGVTGPQPFRPAARTAILHVDSPVHPSRSIIP